MLGRRSFITRGVPALTALALTSCRQSSSIDSSAMKRERRAARRARAQRSDDKAQPQSLRAEWPNAIHEGDCTIQKGATFVLDINGNNQWECNVSSTDSGDDFKLRVYLDDSSFDQNSGCRSLGPRRSSSDSSTAHPTVTSGRTSGRDGRCRPRWCRRCLSNPPRRCAGR